MRKQPQQRSAIWRLLHGRHDPGWGTRADDYDPEQARQVLARLSLVFGPGRYFPIEVQGWEHLPPPPVMLVANHSGGTLIPDAWGWAHAWYSHLGVERPLHFLVHEIMLATRITGPFFSRVGVLRASRQRAVEVLREWKRDVMVMPGGDRDLWRPWSERYRVQFAGHVGYARVALEAGVPIVPVANAGPHETLRVLSDGARLARWLRLHRLFRIDVLPIHLSLPWGLGVGPLPHFPLPARFRYRLGPPVMPPAEHEVGTEPGRDLVHAHDEEVRRVMQQQLDALAQQER